MSLWYRFVGILLLSFPLQAMEPSLVQQLPRLTELNGFSIWATPCMNATALRYFNGTGGYRISIRSILSFRPTQPSDPVYSLSGSYDAYLQDRLCYSNASIMHQSLSLALSPQPTDQEMRNALSELRRWNKFIHGMLIMYPDETTLIADDPSMQKIVTVLACWLIYMDCGLEEALRRAKEGRLVGNLEERYALLIGQYYNQHTSMNCIQRWWDSDIDWSEVYRSDGVDYTRRVGV